MRFRELFKDQRYLIKEYLILYILNGWKVLKRNFKIKFSKFKMNLSYKL